MVALSVAVLLVWISTSAEAIEKPSLTVEGPGGSTWRVEIANRLRGEFVDWFDPGPASPTPRFRYDFLGERFQAGVRVTRDPVEVFLQYQHTVLDNVPEAAVGPGGVYFANTKRSFQEQGFLRQGWVKAQEPVGPWTLGLTAGRQIYADGGETASKDPTLQWVKQFRVAERLIGPFEYTFVGRSFDGVRVSADDEVVNLTGFALHPTSGGFEVSGGRDIASIDLAGASATLKDRRGFDRTEARLFWLYYADDRPQQDDLVVLDNRPLTVRERDRDEIAIHTVGANAARVEPVGPGTVDALAWTAGQFGDWQSLDHRAWAYALELGYQLPGIWASPWMRAGLFRSSGDNIPSDGTHETFFQMVPTARQYAQFPFFNLMNNQDTFAQLIVKPHARLTVRADFHWLRVTEGKDFLYSGGGATKDDFFGYLAVPANGHRQVGYLADIALTYRALDFLTLYAYYGHAFGEDVIRAAFMGRDANYGYIEATVAF